MEAILEPVTVVTEEVSGAIGKMGADDATADAMAEEIEREEVELRREDRKILDRSSDK